MLRVKAQDVAIAPFIQLQNDLAPLQSCRSVCLDLRLLIWPTCKPVVWRSFSMFWVTSRIRVLQAQYLQVCFVRRQSGQQPGILPKSQTATPRIPGHGGHVGHEHVSEPTKVVNLMTTYVQYLYHRYRP